LVSLYNAAANTFGFGTVGEVAGNVEMRTRNPMTAEQQAADAEWRASLGQQVSENPDVNVTPVTGPGTIETTDLPPESGGGSGSGWSESGDQGNGVTTSPVASGSVSTTNLANGGQISGPGTGTSDSIPARLSNGETVVTAQTTAKVKELFGEDFFHNLEAQFNAPAAVNQKLKGRA